MKRTCPYCNGNGEVDVGGTLPEVMKYYIEASGLSNKEIAELAGCSPSFVTTVMRGKYENISITKLADVCKAIDVNLSEVLANAEL